MWLPPLFSTLKRMKYFFLVDNHTILEYSNYAEGFREATIIKNRERRK